MWYQLRRYSQAQGIPSQQRRQSKATPVASENLTYNQPSWKRCERRGKLLLNTNTKLYMGFRLVPKSVTLNDLERRKAIILHYFAELGSFRGQLRKSG